MTDGTALDAALAQIDQAFGTSLRTGLPATMTERVARQLCRQYQQRQGTHWEMAKAIADNEWPSFVDAARRIFEAMVSPTEEMLDDIEGAMDKDDYQDIETQRERIVYIWQALLTTADYELDEDELARKARQAEADRKWREAGCPVDPTDVF